MAWATVAPRCTHEVDGGPAAGDEGVEQAGAADDDGHGGKRAAAWAHEHRIGAEMEHEALHALGFYSASWPLFRNADGTPNAIKAHSVPLTVVGLMLVLRNSFKARKQFVRFQHAHPKLIFPLRRLLRRDRISRAGAFFHEVADPTYARFAPGYRASADLIVRNGG